MHSVVINFSEEEFICYYFQERHSGTSLDKMSISTHSTSSTGEDSAGLLGMPQGKITKALSMSSIPAATNGDKPRGEDLHRFKTILSWGCQMREVFGFISGCIIPNMYRNGNSKTRCYQQKALASLINMSSWRGIPKIMRCLYW